MAKVGTRFPPFGGGQGTPALILTSGLPFGRKIVGPWASGAHWAGKTQTKFAQGPGGKGQPRVLGFPEGTLFPLGIGKEGSWDQFPRGKGETDWPKRGPHGVGIPGKTGRKLANSPVKKPGRRAPGPRAQGPRPQGPEGHFGTFSQGRDWTQYSVFHFSQEKPGFHPGLEPTGAQHRDPKAKRKTAGNTRYGPQVGTFEFPNFSFPGKQEFAPRGFFHTLKFFFPHKV